MKKNEYCNECGFVGEYILTFAFNHYACLHCTEKFFQENDPSFSITKNFFDSDEKDAALESYYQSVAFQRTDEAVNFKKIKQSHEHEHGFSPVPDAIALKNPPHKILQPKEVQKFIKERVIGQDEAIKEIGIAISHHTKRMRLPEVEKSNILLLGPSGTGKTHMFRALADLLDVPFSIMNATEYTGAGFVGQDVDQILASLYFTAKKDAYLAEKGIVLIDEADKIAVSKDSAGEGVNTKRVQDELLKMIEGTTMKVNVGSRNQPQIIDMNTHNILFVLAGAFEGLKEIVERKDNQAKKTIGLTQSNETQSSTSDWQSRITTSHLMEYGIAKELLGRLPVVTYTKDLSIEELKKIMTEPKNSIISQQKQLLNLDRIQADFSDEFLSQVAKEAIEQKTGARGLKSILSQKLKELYFNIDQYEGNKILIDINGVSICSSNRARQRPVFQ